MLRALRLASKLRDILITNDEHRDALGDTSLCSRARFVEQVGYGLLGAASAPAMTNLQPTMPTIPKRSDCVERPDNRYGLGAAKLG